MFVNFPAEARLRGLAINVTLCYDASEPYAVALKICRNGGIDPILLARDLLNDGLLDEVGEGAVAIMPGDEYIDIEMCMPRTGLPVTLRFARDDVHEFLRTVFLAVPVGTESERLDWSDVDALLAGGAS